MALTRHSCHLGMTLVIQRAEHRDTQAIHAKLDELLRANHRANNDLMSMTTRMPKRSSRIETEFDAPNPVEQRPEAVDLR